MKMYLLRKGLMSDMKFVDHIRLDKIKDFNNLLEKAEKYIQYEEVQKVDKAMTSRSEKQIENPHDKKFGKDGERFD